MNEQPFEIVELKINYRTIDGVVRFISFSPDGRLLASASKGRLNGDTEMVWIWNAETGEKQTVLQGHDGYVVSFDFSPDGRCLASASSDKTVRIWNTETGKELRCLEGHTEGVRSVSFSPDGKRLASVSKDHTVRLWDIRPYTLFLHNSKPTPLYHTFIEAVKFLWQLDVQGLEVVHKERTLVDMENFGSLLAPPPPRKSKFDQVLEWAEKQQENAKQSP